MCRTALPVIAAAALVLGACNSSGEEPEPTETEPTGAAPTSAPPEPRDTETESETPEPAETQEPEPEPQQESTTEDPDNGPPDEAEEPANAEFILRVSVSSTGPPMTNGEHDYDQMASGFYDASQTDLVDDVYISGPFEGWSAALIGLANQAQFLAFTLPEPSRLVIDISTENE